MKWTCEYCGDHVVRGETRDDVKEEAKRHLLSVHPDELEESFVTGYRGKKCRDCSTRFPRKQSDFLGLDCPECGHDHSTWYAGFKAGLTIRPCDG